jgi:hypothetical protein
VEGPPGELVVVGRLTVCVDVWWRIGVGLVVLQLVTEGLWLVLLGTPVEDNHHLPFTAAQLVWLRTKLEQLVQACAVKWMGKGETHPAGVLLVSLVFLVPKKGPKMWQLIIDQHWLNLVLAMLQCKFKSLLTLMQLA